MALESHTFPSGLQLYVDHVPHARSAYASVYVGVGSAHETREEAGMAHLLEHAVYLGTQNFNTEEKLCAFADNEGFWANAYTQHLHTEHVTQGPKFEPMLKYLGEVVTRPLLWQRPMQGELEVVKQELNVRRSDLETVGDVVSEQLHFEEPHGRPVIGLMERLEHKARGVKEFYHRTHRLGSMAVILSGAVDIERALPLVERYFEESPLAEKSGPTDIVVPRATVRPGGIYGFLVNGVESARISVSNPLPEELTEKMARDMVPYTVARELYSTDVYNSFRTRRHLSYQGAFTVSSSNQTDAWLSGGYATVNPENVQRGLRMLDSTLRATLPTTERDHLLRRIRSCAGEAEVMLDSLSKRVDAIVARLDWGVEPVDPEKLAKQYKYLNPKRVLEAVEDLAVAYEQAPRVTLVTGGKDAVKGFERAVANF